MSLALLGFWFLVGICPDWWPRWPRRWPPPPPPPDPWWLTIVSGIGGVIGGWAFSTAFGPGPDGVTAAYAFTTFAGALTGGIVLGGLARAFGGRAG